MAVDKVVDSTQLDADLTSVANAIRAKSGGSGSLAFPAGFVSEIGDIPSGETMYFSNKGFPYTENFEFPQIIMGFEENYKDASHLKTIYCEQTGLIGGSSSEKIARHFQNCTALTSARFPYLGGIKNGYCELFLGQCTALTEAIFGSVGYPISEFANTSYIQKVFTATTQNTLTITLYVNAATLADIPSEVTAYAPWGATGATIVYRNSTTGEVITA